MFPGIRVFGLPGADRSIFLNRIFSLALIAMATLTLTVCQASAQRGARSPYSPKLEAFYASIDSSAALTPRTGPIIGVSVTSTMKQTCTRSIELAGGVPVILPCTSDPTVIDGLMDILDGLMFSGGDDVNPDWYGEAESPECGDIDDERDLFELMLFKKATDRNIPIFGVCRGLQLINVAMGGSLIQDIPSEHPSDIRHSVTDDSLVPAHEITIEEGSLLADLLGATSFGVNSRHHQAIDRLAPGLRITARSADGIPEAIEAYPIRQIMAVQFHPEINAAAGDTVQLRLFRHFVEQAELFAKAKDIHSRILSVDTHCDTPLNLARGGGLAERSRQQQVSVPKMRDGHLDAQFLAAYLGQKEENPASLKRAAESCDALVRSIRAEIDRHSDICGLAITEADARELKAQGRKAFFIGIENGFGLGGDISAIAKFKDMGVNYITLCHSHDNMICHSSTHTEGGQLGLTEFGREVVKEMNRLGVVIDLSHASRGTFMDVMRESSLPVFCSHSGAKAICNSDRNIDDEQLRALASNGGVVQICMYSGYVSNEPAKANIDDVIKHIEHCVAVAGIDHVGIGSDFDGGGGIDGINGSDDMIRITEKLLERGWSEEDLAKLWGANFFRVLAANQAAASQTH